MIVGYARTSTTEQLAGLDAQLRDLRNHGCEEIYQEQVSSVAKRGELDNALRFVRRGDSLVVTKIDRLARSTSHLLKIVDDLEKRGVSLVILSMGGQVVDTSSPTGRLMITMLASVAEFERSLMLERQREGIAKAKAEKRYTGRQPTAKAKADDVIKLAKEGMTREKIAETLHIGIASVYRILKAASQPA